MASLLVARSWKQFEITFLLREEIGKMRWMYTMEQYATTRRRRGLAEHKVTWIDLKNIGIEKK